MIFGILVCVLVVVYFWLNLFKKSQTSNVAILPNRIPILGNILQLFSTDPFSLIMSFGDHSIKNDGIVSIFVGPIPVYVISDPIYATTILNTCLEKSVVYKLINPLCGDTLVSAKGSVWKHNRKILDYAFRAQILESYVELFNKQASRLVQLLDDNAYKGYVDIANDITNIVLETSCQTTMGSLPNDEKYVTIEYAETLHKSLKITYMRLQRIWMIFDFIFYFSEAKRDLDKALAYIAKISSKMVALRKSKYYEPTRGNNTQKDNLHCFLDIVLENSTTDEGGCIFSDTELRCLSDNILLAAFDTTACELLLTLVCIGSDKKVQQKIFQEIQDVLGEEERVNKEHLPKLINLEAAIKEACRLYPVGPIVGRRSTENIVLGNTTFPAGSEFAVHLWAINRNKKYWGADADEFNPGRWLDADTLPRHPNAFASFSFGRRNCIGKQYAMMLMKTMLVPILRRYCVTANHKNMTFDCYIMLKAKSGHLVKLELR